MSNPLAQTIASPATEAATSSDAPAVLDGSSEAVVTPEGSQAPVVEQPVTAAHFAALARREKAVREEEERVKGANSKYTDYQKLEELAKSNPTELMAKFGLTLEGLVQAHLGEEEEPKSVQDQLQELKDQLASEKKDKEDQSSKQIQNNIDEAIAAHQSSITSFLEDNKDQYELIGLTDNTGLVWDVTEAYYDEHNVVLTPQEAADKVEEHLLIQFKKAQGITKLQRQETSDTPKPEHQSPFYTTPTVTESKTLVSDLTGMSDPKMTPKLSDEESKLASASLIKWT